jgi:hypothetical protein
VAPWGRLPIDAILRLLTSPRSLGRLARAAWRFRRHGWYRRPPFLPVPSAAYLEWRLATAYREAGAGPEPAELERYLTWSEGLLSADRPWEFEE